MRQPQGNAMASRDQGRTLQRFNEKVERLERLRFLPEAARAGSIVEWRRGIGWEGIHVGPERESIEAAVLTLRFFLQNNESTSLCNMAALYPVLGVSAGLVQEFQDLRQSANAYLDTRSNLAISDEGQMTYRDILELFLWGDLSHANAVHEATFRVVSQTAFFPLFQMAFIETMRHMIQMLRLMRDINSRALAELGL
jgi:hypothetical protein